MSDIVERLRVNWDNMGDMANAERNEAAYAIIDLRNECAMEVAHTKEIRQQVTELRALLAEALTQRDEARREVLLWVKERCSWAEMAQEIKQRGWEYLKEESK